MAPKRKSDCNEASSPSKQQKVQPAEISMIERSKLVDPNISGRRLCTIISWFLSFFELLSNHIVIGMLQELEAF